MKNNNMQEQLNTFYQGQGLSEERMAELQAKIQEASQQAGEEDLTGEADLTQEKTKPSFKIWHYWPRLVTAAAIVLIVTAMSVQFYLSHAHKVEVTDRALQSIAMNHQSYLDSESPIKASIGELRDAMPKLNFQPVDPEKLRQLGFTPMGARYCSINGERAVLIKMKDKQGLTWTLYQCLDSDKLKAVKSCDDKTDGTYVTIWREDGLVLAMAGPKPLADVITQ